MGGGAGINFDFRISGFHARWSRKRGIFVPCEQPAIESFDALGYMDGMRGVTGRFLSLSGVQIEKPHPDDKEWFDRNLNWRNPCWIAPQGKAEEMIFAGYVRGVIDDQFPMEVSTECTAEGYFVGRLGFMVNISNRDDFQGWRADAFDAWSEVPVEEWDDFCHWREINYGAAA